MNNSDIKESNDRFEKLLQTLSSTSQTIQSLNTSFSTDSKNSDCLRSISRQAQLELKNQLSINLDQSLTLFRKLPVVTAEDRLMIDEIKSLKSYFKRITQLSKPKVQINQSTSKRFINHSIGNQSTSDQNNKKTKLSPTRSISSVNDSTKEKVDLPEIRQVVKNAGGYNEEQAEDESENDKELTVYED